MNRFVSVILIIMMFNVGNVAAQQRVEAAEMFDKVFPLLGNWGVNYGPEGQDRWELPADGKVRPANHFRTARFQPINSH